MHRRAPHRGAAPHRSALALLHPEPALELPRELDLRQLTLRVRRPGAVRPSLEPEVVQPEPRAELVELAAHEHDPRGRRSCARLLERGHEQEREERGRQEVCAVVRLVPVLGAVERPGHVEDAGVVQQTVQRLVLGQEG